MMSRGEEQPKLWCVFCGKWGNHQSGAHDSTKPEKAQVDPALTCAACGKETENIPFCSAECEAGSSAAKKIIYHRADGRILKALRSKETFLNRQERMLLVVSERLHAIGGNLSNSQLDGLYGALSRFNAKEI